jgi:hypothetical protein
MKTRKNYAGWIALIAIFGVCIFAGCDNQEDNWVFSSDKCLFVEHHKYTNGVLIEGNTPHKGPMIDFSGYSFNESSKILEGVIDFKIDKSLKVIFGSGKSLGGFAGGGIASGLYGIYEIPFKQGAFEITDVSFDGTIQVQYKDSLIVLKYGETWENISSEIITQNDNGNVSKINYITKDRIVNYGIIDKKEIKEIQ